MSGNLKSQKPNDWQNSWNAKTSERFKCPSCKLFFSPKNTNSRLKARISSETRTNKQLFCCKSSSSSSRGKRRQWLTQNADYYLVLVSAGCKDKSNLSFGLDLVWPRPNKTTDLFHKPLFLEQSQTSLLIINCTTSKEVANQFIIESIWRLPTKKLF